MTRYFTTMLLCTVLVTISPGRAAANTDLPYDTVDAVEPTSDTGIQVTGIRSGQGAPSTMFYGFLDATVAERCMRSALLAMSKPGKFQLVIVLLSFNFTCRLVVRTP